MEKIYFRIFAVSMLLFILFTLVKSISIEVSGKEINALFKEQTDKKVLPEKPCNHVFFNRYCIDCREYRDKYEN